MKFSELGLLCPMVMNGDVDQPYDSRACYESQAAEGFTTPSGIPETSLASIMSDSKMHRSAEPLQPSILL